MADERGAFVVGSLDPTLLFRVLVVAEGHRARFLEKVDPASGTVDIRLDAALPTPTDPRCVLHGRVIDAEGHPVAQAAVWPRMHMRADGTGGSRMPDGMDPVGVTNARGEFRIVSPVALRDLSFRVEARGLAARVFNEVAPALSPHELRLDAGVTVHGRIVKDGAPLARVSVGLVQADRRIERFVGEYVIGSDGDGRFEFVNVAADSAYFIYGKMESLKSQGASPVRRLELGKAGSTVDAGELAVVQGLRLSGRLALSDGSAVPNDTPILLSREQAWDSQEVRVGGDGRFEFIGLPQERYRLSARVGGYRPSEKNRSLDRWNRFDLIGRIERDIEGLVLLYEPEARESPPRRDATPDDPDKPLRGAE